MRSTDIARCTARESHTQEMHRERRFFIIDSLFPAHGKTKRKKGKDINNNSRCIQCVRYSTIVLHEVSFFLEIVEDFHQKIAH